MTPQDSNSLLRALAKGRAVDHPDADLLTGFAEKSLLAREREAVMAHLAGCAECREVLHLSAVELEQAREFELVAAAPGMAAPAMMPAAASAPAPIERKGPRVVRVWLPWAAVAASIAIVSVVALRYGLKKTEPITAAPGSETIAVNAPPPKVSAPAPPTAAVSERRETRQEEAEKKARSAPAPVLQQQVAPQLAGSRNSATAARQSSPQQTAALDQMTTQNLIVSAGSIRAQNAPQIQAKGAPQESAQMALHGQASPPAPASLPASTGGPRGLTNALAGSFAKSANASLVTRPHWRIDDEGTSGACLRRWRHGRPWPSAIMRDCMLCRRWATWCGPAARTTCSIVRRTKVRRGRRCDCRRRTAQSTYSHTSDSTTRRRERSKPAMARHGRRPMAVQRGIDSSEPHHT